LGARTLRQGFNLTVRSSGSRGEAVVFMQLAADASYSELNYDGSSVSR
jgi:hypothetical protein